MPKINKRSQAQAEKEMLTKRIQQLIRRGIRYEEEFQETQPEVIDLDAIIEEDNDNDVVDEDNDIKLEREHESSKRLTNKPVVQKGRAVNKKTKQRVRRTKPRINDTDSETVSQSETTEYETESESTQRPTNKISSKEDIIKRLEEIDKKLQAQRTDGLQAQRTDGLQAQPQTSNDKPPRVKTREEVEAEYIKNQLLKICF